MSNDLIRRYVARSLPIVATLGLASPAAHAWDFQNSDGTVTGSWDTTFTYGQAYRIESRDCRLIAIADGGCGRSPNIDDGIAHLKLEQAAKRSALEGRPVALSEIN